MFAKRPVNQDGLIGEWPEEGLIATEGPYDPASSVKVENSRIVEPNGKSRAEFNMIDRSAADYAINVVEAERIMQPDALEISRILVGIHVSREEIIVTATAITPAKAVEVMVQMNVVEMMMALRKMCARRAPSNQCHVTNLKDNPVQIVTDTAEAGIRDFSKQEATVGIARCAPFNALALLVGSQCGCPGVLTQCPAEEVTELELGMRGLTSYAEAVSVYGTESMFTDGDDMLQFKAFFASAYAPRGLKMRYTSGTGLEALVGYSKSESVLYLESRCIFITKGTGVQELQNGVVNRIGMTGAVSSGTRAVLAEDLTASMLDPEVASANDQTFSHFDIRRTTRTLMQMLPGTDFTFSGYSMVPNYDNMFVGSNFDVEDFDDYNIPQRDPMIDGGLCPVTGEETIAIYNKAIRAIQAMPREPGLPLISDEEVEAATYAHGSKDMPARNVVEDLAVVEEMIKRNITGLDTAGVLSCSGLEDIASSISSMLRQCVTGDYLQASVILDRQLDVANVVNGINDCQGPGIGYRISAERWAEIKNIAGVVQPGLIE